MTLSPTWIGIDVSKAWLDIASSGGEGVQRIANTMDAIAAFAATLEREGTLVVLEASGVYDRSLRAGLALAGLAPLNNDSGLRRGQRSIRGGRRRVRQALYMAAVASLRTHSPLNAFYHRLRQAGKPPKPALVALARMLLVTINAIMKTRTSFAT